MSMLQEMFDGENRQTINERPYSRTQSAIDSAKGKVKGAFGSGQIEQGAAEVGSEANRKWMDFKRYIGRKYGKAQASVPYADVVEFFKGNQLDPKFLGNNPRRSFAPKDVGQALLAAVREYMNEYGANSSDEQPQPGQPPQGNNQPSSQPQSNGNPPSSQPQTDSNQPSSGGMRGVLASLSAQERDQLLRLLS